MCGRYASTADQVVLLDAFDIPREQADDPLPPSWNLAPTDQAPVVVARVPKDDPDAEPARQLRNLRWGLVPSWAKDPSVGSRMINARAETVATKPAFRRPFASRRALVPAAGFFEWIPQTPVAGGKPVKQPYFIHPTDGNLFAFAGIFDFWRPAPDTPWLTTFSIITTTATDDLGHLHDRMPMTVAEPLWRDWLDPRVGADQAVTLMAAPEPGTLATYPVSRAVNSVRNNGPELIQQVSL